jgi:hypothetical protein
MEIRFSEKKMDRKSSIRGFWIGRGKGRGVWPWGVYCQSLGKPPSLTACKLTATPIFRQVSHRYWPSTALGFSRIITIGKAMSLEYNFYAYTVNTHPVLFHSELLSTQEQSSTGSPLWPSSSNPKRSPLPCLISHLCSQLKWEFCCCFILSWHFFSILTILIKNKTCVPRAGIWTFWQGLLAWASTLDDHTVHGPSSHDHLLEWLSAHSQAHWIVSLGHGCQAILGLNKQST